MSRRRPDHDGECDCFPCRLDSVQFSPAATPTRRSPKADPGPKLIGNSWENGIAKDERGMPYLDETGKTIGVKAWGETHRRKFTDAGLA